MDSKNSGRVCRRMMKLSVLYTIYCEIYNIVRIIVSKIIVICVKYIDKEYFRDLLVNVSYDCER